MDTEQIVKAIRRLTPYRLSVYQLLRERAIKESAKYAEAHLDTAMIFDRAPALWTYAASRANISDGLILEFGVFKGRSINHFAKCFSDQRLHGFDSFEGLAEDWTGYHLAKGAFDQGGQLPRVAGNVTLHKGWFHQSLPDFLSENQGSIRFCHMDCDTYPSSKYVLDTIAPRFVQGSIIVFDEYYGYPNWRSGEFRAWQEVVAEHNLSYDYIGFSNMQVAIEIV